MRGIDQNPLIYFERASHGNTDRGNRPVAVTRSADQFVRLLHNQRKRVQKWCSGNLDPLENLASDGTLDTCRLRTPDVQAKHGAQTGLSSLDQIPLQHSVGQAAAGRGNSITRR